MKISKDNFRDSWDKIEQINIHSIQLPGVEERQKGAENFFEKIKVESSPNTGKELTSRSKNLRVPNKRNLKRPTVGHIIIKVSEVEGKETILKAARRKQLLIHKGTPIRLSSDFSAETLQAKRTWHDILKVLKETENLPNKNALHGGTDLHNRRGNQEISRQAKAKGVHHHWTSLKINGKGTSLN